MPVVVRKVDSPLLTEVTSWSLIRVVMVVVQALLDVDTRGVVSVVGAVTERSEDFVGLSLEEGAEVEDGPGEGVGEGVEEGPLDGVLLGGSVGVEDGGGLEVGVEDEGGGGGGVEDGVGDGLLPVPPAWRLTPWMRYSSMPSRLRSPMLRADENATRAKRAKRSQDDRIVLSMFGR